MATNFVPFVHYYCLQYSQQRVGHKTNLNLEKTFLKTNEKLLISFNITVETFAL